MEHLMLTMLLFMMDHCHLVDIHKSHNPCQYSYNIELPNVKYMSQNEMQNFHYDYNIPASQRVELKALYDYNTKTVYLLNTWNRDNIWDLSDLAHELYHHVQYTNNPRQKYMCHAYTEIPAYKIQLTYLKYKHRQSAYAPAINEYKNMSCNMLYK